MRPAGLRLRPTHGKVTLHCVNYYIGIQLFFAPSRPYGAVGRSSRSFVARFVAGAPPRSSSPAGAPAPSPSSPLPTVAPRRGRRGFGRAVSGYALIIFFRLPPSVFDLSSSLYRLGHGHSTSRSGGKCLRPLRYFLPELELELFAIISEIAPPDRHSRRRGRRRPHIPLPRPSGLAPLSAPPVRAFRCVVAALLHAIRWVAHAPRRPLLGAAAPQPHAGAAAPAPHRRRRRQRLRPRLRAYYRYLGGVRCYARPL